MHHAPTRASWPKPAGRWSGMIGRHAIKRPGFRSATELKQRLLKLTEEHNGTAAPFAWVGTADPIFEKLDRLCTCINGTPC